MPDKSDLAYSAIGAAFSDDDIKDFVKRSTGIPITDIVGERDPPKKKIEKVVEFLRDRGNQRWLLTRVMFHATAGDMVRQKIVDAFPETLIGLPKVGDHVTRALAYLSKVLSVPLPREVKYRLRPSRRSFARMPKCVIALFAYKTLQECLLRLLFTLNANEALLANRAEGVTPELRSVADHIDQAIEQVQQTLSLLDADSPPISEGELAKLEQFAASLRTSADAPENAVVVIENLQRLVRRSLSQLNNDIFKLVQDLSDASAGTFERALALNDMAWTLTTWGIDGERSQQTPTSCNAEADASDPLDAAREAICIIEDLKRQGSQDKDYDYWLSTFRDTQAYILMQTDRMPEAKALYEKDMGRTEKDGGMLFRYAITLFAVGDESEAAERFDTAIKGMNYLPSDELQNLRRRIPLSVKRMVYEAIDMAYPVPKPTRSCPSEAKPN